MKVGKSGRSKGLKENREVRFFRKFKEVDRDYVLSDKHLHTTWGDGQATIEEIIQKAKEVGLKQIAFTEHVRSDSTYFEEYAREINRFRPDPSLEILTGFEAKINNFEGEIDAAEKDLKSAEIKIASVHRFPLGKKLYYPNQFDKAVCQEIELELSVAAIRKGMCNCLGHPGGMSVRTYNEFPLHFFEEIISECEKNNIAFDLNSSYHLPVYQELLKLLRKYNPYVSLGSDAHTLDQIGAWVHILDGSLSYA